MWKRRRTINDSLDVLCYDVHFGEEDPVAVECFDRVIEHLRPRRLFQAGDLKEFAPFSAHLPMHVFKDYDWEAKEVVPAENWVKHKLKHCGTVHLLGGNHEFRPERWAAGMGPQGKALWPRIDPALIVPKTDPSRVTYIPYVNDRDITARYEIAPNLIFIHGWTHAKQAATVHLGRAAMAGWSVAFGHVHRHLEDSVRCPRTNVPIVAFSGGCLRSLVPKWTQADGPTSWTHGFSLVYHSQKNPCDWTHYSPYIVNGRVILPDGTEIRV